MEQRVNHTAESLFACFEALGISYKNHTHPGVFTVAESKSLRGQLRGGHTKNLFLRDKKKRFWLLTALESQTIDLKKLKRYLGAQGSLSFGTAEMLAARLGVTPGAVTPFSVINDPEGAVGMLLDRRLLDTDPLNAHPLRNDMTVAISPFDLLRYLETHNHAPDIIDFAELT
ncbi:MAG: prolyl-tRNA synthetase associated domain-containing protein [Proteobacteria bacterium]|nr:prolyl-tRNA synthetase associated domain-containing protein [Pseudomonadota bacterium]